MLSRLRSLVHSMNFWAGRYGRVAGAKIALQLKFGDYNRRLFAVDLPDYRFPIWLRGGTVDLQTFFQIFVASEYDVFDTDQGRSLRHQYKNLAASGDQPLIIDCGANIGLSCIWFAKQFPNSRIVGIEPDLGNIEVASKNVSPYPNVQIMRGAVWDADRHLAIVNPDADPWAYRVQEAPDRSGMAAFTINKISGGAPIFIVKIDIEGAEQALFRSNTEWVGNTSLIAIELHDWMFPRGGTSRNFMQTISSHKCDILQRGENLFFFMAD